MEFIEVKPESYPPRELLNKDWTQRKCWYAPNGQALVDKIHAMQVKDDDVWLVTPPKCGTTWMQELLWLVINNFDFETAKNVDLELRTPFLEFDFVINENAETALKPVEDLRSPRLIKSHLPLPLLPKQLWIKQPKTIFVFRNPKDSIISEYYHARSVGFSMDKTLSDYVREYLEQNSNVPCEHFEHVTEFYALRHVSWLFYTSFECMKLNLRQVIEDVCKFLNKSINETQMQQMLHHLSFEQMKNNPKLNHLWEFSQLRRKYNTQFEQHNFVRKGQMGGYKEELSPELIAKFDAWLDKQLAHYKLTLNELLLLDQNM